MNEMPLELQSSQSKSARAVIPSINQMSMNLQFFAPEALYENEGARL